MDVGSVQYSTECSKLNSTVYKIFTSNKWTINTINMLHSSGSNFKDADKTVLTPLTNIISYDSILTKHHIQLWFYFVLKSGLLKRQRGEKVCLIFSNKHWDAKDTFMIIDEMLLKGRKWNLVLNLVLCRGTESAMFYCSAVTLPSVTLGGISECVQ